MRRFAQIIALLALGGGGLLGCAEAGEDLLNQAAGQGGDIPGGPAGTGGMASVSGGAGGTSGAAGMAGAAGTGSGGSSGTGGTGGSAGTGSGGSSATGGTGGSAGTGSGGSSGTGGTGGSAGTGSGGSSGTGGTGGTGGDAGTTPMPMPDYAPSPNNPAECPAVAPENPVGDCLGLPVYLVCEYGDDTYWYVCTCDWYHWLCAGT